MPLEDIEEFEDDDDEEEEEDDELPDFMNYWNNLPLPNQAARLNNIPLD